MRLTDSSAKIYVAGHRGMVGRAVWSHLKESGYANLVGRTSDELDLRDPHATREFFEAEQPDVVVLAAARVGGILANAVRFVLEQPEEKIREVAQDGILNVGVGEDLSINDLMALIQNVVGHDGPVTRNRSKPDGTPRKLVDTSRMDKLGWQADTGLREGVQSTYDWYREQRLATEGRDA